MGWLKWNVKLAEMRKENFVNYAINAIAVVIVINKNAKWLI